MSVMVMMADTHFAFPCVKNVNYPFTRVEADHIKLANTKQYRIEQNINDSMVQTL